MANLPERITSLLPKLNEKQQRWVLTLTSALADAGQFDAGKSDFVSKEVADDLGVVLIAHHNLFSGEPFSKDKFEYALARSLALNGHRVEMSSKGFRGRDLTVDGVGISLKTQANDGIKHDRIWVSKWMELGKGVWTDQEEDFRGLIAQFHAHMKSYDRIFTLRAFKDFQGQRTWHYELVEIPKSLMLASANGRIEISHGSKHVAKPAYCYVTDPKTGEPMYQLYFDGGGERKLQVQELMKKFCVVHATWDFEVKPLAES